VRTNWEVIKHFKKEEFAPEEVPAQQSDWDMHHSLVRKLDHIRAEAARLTDDPVRIIIRRNGGFALEGHSANSLHGGYQWNAVTKASEPYIGRAADFTIEEKIDGEWTPWSWLKQAVFVRGYIGPECGMGIYPWWHRPGIHLDYRLDVPDRTPAVWVRDPGDTYHALPFDQFYELVDFVSQVEASMVETVLSEKDSDD